MAELGFLDRGSADATTAIMARLLDELKRETATRDLLESLQERAGVRYTAGGLLMLVIPTVEAAELQQMRTDIRANLGAKVDRENDVDLATVRRSLERIARASLQDPSVVDANLVAADTPIPARTSLSVIKAFTKVWCNIPPFCDSK